jgi:hypothetical protein
MFDAARPDPVRLVHVPFGDAWLELVDPADLAAPDPMDVRVRLGMYRHLVERLNPHGRFGARNELSPFWGYASQLAWQLRSGRLGSAGSAAIADGSWWGACNFALSVVPYVAAMKFALVPALRVKAPGYDSVLPAWHAAFDTMLARDADHDEVRVRVWAAHLASIRLAVRHHEVPFLAMPLEERRFARGWIRMVDLFAAAAVRTDLDKLVETGGGALPSRVLRERDPLDDLHRYEVSTVRRVGELADRGSWRWAIETRIWRHIMRTRAARAQAETLLAGMLGKSAHRWPATVRALAYATLPARIVELTY